MNAAPPDATITDLATPTADLAIRSWHDHPWMLFQVYEVEHIQDGARHYDGDVTDPDQVTPVVHGRIASDGCSRWWWDADMHVCGREDIDSHAALMRAVFDLAAVTLPNWDKDLGGAPGEGGDTQ